MPLNRGQPAAGGGPGRLKLDSNRYPQVVPGKSGPGRLLLFLRA